MDIAHLRVVVLGAGGFLGTNLVGELLPSVAELRCFGHQPEFPAAFDDVQWITGDIASPELGAVLSGCDVVIHLASASGPVSSNLNVVADAEASLMTTLRLLEQSRTAGVKRFVLISSGGTVYGIPQQLPLVETANVLPITAYGASKLACEKYLEVYRHQFGLDYRVLRLSNPFGPYQTARRNQGVIAAFLMRALRGEPLEIWGDGSVVRDYLYVTDVNKAIIASLIHEGSSRVFNIGSGTGLSLLSVAKEVSSLFGAELPLSFRPGRTADVPVNILDCTLAKKELGWAATTPFSSGLQKSLDWLRGQFPTKSCDL